MATRCLIVDKRPKRRHAQVPEPRLLRGQIRELPGMTRVVAGARARHVAAEPVLRITDGAAAYTFRDESRIAGHEARDLDGNELHLDQAAAGILEVLDPLEDRNRFPGGLADRADPCPGVSSRDVSDMPGNRDALAGHGRHQPEQAREVESVRTGFDGGKALANGARIIMDRALDMRHLQVDAGSGGTVSGKILIHVAGEHLDAGRARRGSPGGTVHLHVDDLAHARVLAQIRNGPPIEHQAAPCFFARLPRRFCIRAFILASPRSVPSCQVPNNLSNGMRPSE